MLKRIKDSALESRWGKAAIFFGGAAISFLCLSIAFRKLDWPSFWLHLRSMDLSAIVAGLVLVNGSNFLLAKRWHLIVSTFGSVSYWNAFWSLRISFFFNATLPARLGEPFRIFYLHRKSGLSPARTLGALGADRLLDLTTMIALLYISVIVLGMRGTLPSTKSIALIIVFGFILLFCLAKLPKTSSIPWMNRLLHWRSQIFEGVAPLMRLKILMPTIPISFLGWAIQAWLVMTFSSGVHEPISFFKACMVVAGVNAAIAIPSSPGHIGTFELGAMTMLTYFKVSPDKAATIAVLYHMIQLIPTLLIGAYGYYFHFLTPRHEARKNRISKY